MIPSPPLAVGDWELLRGCFLREPAVQGPLGDAERDLVQVGRMREVWTRGALPRS